MKTFFSKEKSRKEKKADFYILYTLVFAAISLFIYGCFYLNGKSLIWSHDGVPQHINALAYYGKYLRNVLKTLVIDHKLSLPMWDMHIGYGSDILTTLHYYVIGDPLTLLSVFVPEKNTEILYELLIFLRIYLAGIAFSIYCFYRKNPKQATFLGSLVYIFAGWTIYASMKHPYFSNPMIYLPLVLMGIEKVYKKEKPYLFIWATAVAAMSNFYFFYMISVFMVLYAAFRYFGIFLERSVKDVFQWFLKFAGFYLVALMIAATIFLPVIMTLFGTERFQAQNYVPLLYDHVYYEKYLGCLIGENMIQWGVAGFSAVAMAGVFVIFSKKKKYTELKLGFVMMNLFLLIPFAGHVLNGFSYVSNRWIWAYGMLIAYILVKAYPELFTLQIREKRRIFIMLLVYCVLALFADAARTQRNIMAVMMLVLAVFTVVSYGNIFVQGKYLCGMIVTVLVASILLNVSYQYSYEKDYLSEFEGKDEALEALQSGPDKEIKSLEDSSVSRYDQYKTGSYVNSAMYMGTNSTSYYFSVANGNISRFFNEMYLNTPWDYHYSSLDGRTILDRLASVKYFAIKNSGYSYLPYGYDSEAASSKKYKIYENKDSLPLGYTYDSWIPRDKYEKLSVTEKQQALLQGAVVEDSSLPETELSFDDKKADFTIEAGKGCKIKDGKIIVTKENGTVTLGYKGEPGAEVYLVAENLDFDAYSPREQISDKKWDSLTEYEQNTILYEDDNWRYWKESKEAAVDVSLGSVSKTLRIFTDKYNGYSGRHNFLLNMGYKNYSAGTMTLTFSTPGEYTFDDIYLVCQPMDSVERETEQLGSESLQNVKIKTNKITGDIEVSSDKLLVFSIPYSEGFTAYVDGKETELIQANSMYMGVELKKGKHDIVLTYCTPYLRAGMILTVAGLAVFALIVMYYRYPRKRRERGKQVK